MQIKPSKIIKLIFILFVRILFQLQPALAKEYVNKGYERLKKFSLNEFKDKYLKLIFNKVYGYEN